jgi:tetratricopeptide (TPR) repeat protein
MKMSDLKQATIWAFRSARNDLGDKQGAITDYNRAIQLDPNYAWFYSKLGTVYLDLGDYRTAIANYDRAIQLNPDYEQEFRQLKSKSISTISSEDEFTYATKFWLLFSNR